MPTYEEIRKEISKNKKQKNANKFGAEKQIITVKLVKDGVVYESEVRFDSKAELRYYNAKLLPLINSNMLKNLEFHKVYELQPAFEKNGKKYRAINYEADFVITYHDGKEDIIDVKGFSTDVFRLKHRLFEYKYKDKNLVLEMV